MAGVFAALDLYQTVAVATLGGERYRLGGKPVRHAGGQSHPPSRERAVQLNRDYGSESLCYDNRESNTGTRPATSRACAHATFMGMKEKPAKSAQLNLALNRQAPHFYHLLDKYECGIELTGTEVKAIRNGKANLKDGYAIIRRDEAWLLGCHIGHYEPGSYQNTESLRDRRLLLHRQEINKLMGRVKEKGLTLIPLRLYQKGNLIKCEIALAKGKTVFDHRETMRRRTLDREAEQEMHEHRRRHS